MPSPLTRSRSTPARTTPLGAALGAALLVCGTTACSAGHSVTAREGGNVSGDGIGVQIRLGHPSTIQAGWVCTTGTVHITRITPVMVTGKLAVTDWGVRNINSKRYTVGDDPAAGRFTVHHLHGFTQGPFTAPCAPGKHGSTELDITTTALTNTAKASRFTVHYTTDGHSGSFISHIAVAMCAHQAMCDPPSS